MQNGLYQDYHQPGKFLMGNPVLRRGRSKVGWGHCGRNRERDRLKKYDIIVFDRSNDEEVNLLKGNERITESD